MTGRASQLRVVGIGGSLRPNSYSYLALEHVMALLTRGGCRTHIVDLRKMCLPFCDGDGPEPGAAHPGVSEMRTAVSRAHAIVLVTPEYHGSVSGVLKNVLDLLASEHIKGKVAGLVSVLGGPASSNALNELSRIMRSCHAWVMPQYIAIGRAHTVFLDGKIRDSELQRKFEDFAGNLVLSATRICDLNEASGGTPAAFTSEDWYRAEARAVA